MDAATILREARSRAGIGQRDLARRAGVPQPVVSRIERGRVSPRVDTLDRLLRAASAELVLAPRPGAGVDRTLFAERLPLSPGQRLQRAVDEWNRTSVFRRTLG